MRTFQHNMFESQDQQLQKRPRPPQPRPPMQGENAIQRESFTSAVDRDALRGTIPPNLPVDIFSTGDDIPVVNRTPSSEEAVPEAQPQFNAPPPPIPPQLQAKSYTKRKIVVFLLSAFVIAFLLIALYLVYRIMQVRRDAGEIAQEEIPFSETVESTLENPQNVPVPAIEDGGANTIPESGELNEEASQQQPEEPPPITEEELPPNPPVPEQQPRQPEDTDKDGLLDIDELQIGTNLNLIDTDFDGLDDYSEVRIYATNPIVKDTDQDGLSDYMEIKTYTSNPKVTDTDGDGYDDGREVQNGYSPTGPGKL